MIPQQNLHRNINQFLDFAQVIDGQHHRQRLAAFFENAPPGMQREVVCDRGQLLMVSEGSLTEEFSVTQAADRPDRVVKFDGTKIMDINPYAYLQQAGWQMKGDGSKRGGSSGGSSSNNNNNNNNNG